MPIRQPSTEDQAFSFWRRTLAGERVPRIEDIPEAGFYACRMVKGGPLVPVMIWVEQTTDHETGELTEPETLACIVAGEPHDQEWLRRRWTYMRPISAAHYDSLTGRRDDPAMAATHVALDLGAVAPIRP